MNSPVSPLHAGISPYIAPQVFDFKVKKVEGALEGCELSIGMQLICKSDNLVMNAEVEARRAGRTFAQDIINFRRGAKLDEEGFWDYPRTIPAFENHLLAFE